jgi:hypothetical protein
MVRAIQAVEGAGVHRRLRREGGEFEQMHKRDTQGKKDARVGDEIKKEGIVRRRGRVIEQV